MDSTFFGWLSRQSERPDAVGSLARSATRDKLFPRSASRLYLLLLRYDAQAELRSAMKDAHREWRELRRSTRDAE